MSHSAAVDAWRGRERALAGLGVDVEVVTARRWHAGGTEVEPHPAPGERVATARTWGRHPALFVFDPRPLWRALGGSWDVIDIHEEPFSLATAEVLLLRALRGRRTPYVLYTAQNLPKRYPIPFRWLERRALQHASGVSACNRTAARIVEAKGFPGRASTIPLGIDAAEFPPRADRAPAADAVVVGLLGRLVTEKGVGVLLRALATQPRLRARIAGSGPLAGVLPKRLEELGLADRVELVGALPPEDVPGFLASLDVLAVPSIATPRWTEQFGRVAVEAMSVGVPVVASDAGALPDVVGGAGIVVPAGDAALLADAVLEAAGPSRERLRSSGFARARECGWDAVARDYLGLYRAARRRPVGAQPAAVEHPIEIGVVAFGSVDLLRAALEPVAHLPVTVVDNSSLVEIANLCTELGVRYIDPGRNGGFAAGVNRLLRDRLAPEADLLLLNPDARISADDVAALGRALHSLGDLASVGPSQVDDDGHRAQVSWIFPSPGRAWLEAVGAARLRRGPRFAIGSVLLLRAEALAQVGPFDERFFLYAEETDWAYRASMLGWRHAEVTAVTAVHHGAATSTDASLRDVRFHASQERYYRKHFGRLGWQSTRAAVVVGSLVRAALLSGSRGDAARRRALLYLRGPLRVEASVGAR
ncbi:glycosyltransferase [Microbacterium awajiense]|uniref:glycosyltransferase n=1 Tax=Microbacterium awajiense TaxID=415214 RepID=UPI0031DACB69